MVKRLFWVGVGFGASTWLQYQLRKRVRIAAARLSPDSVALRTVDRVRGLGGGLLDALADGRAAMRQREAELREQLAVPGPVESPTLEGSHRDLLGGSPRHAVEHGRQTEVLGARQRHGLERGLAELEVTRSGGRDDPKEVTRSGGRWWPGTGHFRVGLAALGVGSKNP